jgi:hypothetical protein
VFQEDWQLADKGKEQEHGDEKAPAEKVARKLAKAVVREMAPVGPVLEEIIKEMGGDKAQMDLVPGEVEASVKDAVKLAVKEAVQEAVEHASEERAENESDAA